jgi:hypothetical protein
VEIGSTNQGDLLNDLQRHCRMNFPHRITFRLASSVRMVRGRVCNVIECFASDAITCGSPILSFFDVLRLKGNAPLFFVFAVFGRANGQHAVRVVSARDMRASNMSISGLN